MTNINMKYPSLQFFIEDNLNVNKIFLYQGNFTTDIFERI